MSVTSPASRAFRFWNKLGLGYLPIADVVSEELPLTRLLRLALFQVSVGMTVALVVGTLNRVMIVELGVSARLVAIMVALPLIFAPARALIGFRSDNHRSLLGWRRTPYLWFGTMLQFGGLAMMPFALLLLSGAGGGHSAPWVGSFAVSVAFLLTGAGLHTTQTVGLALATDIAPERSRPQVVAVLCAMLLLGVLISALLFGILLAHFTVEKLIQVIQGAALMTMILNGIALWKQEPRRALTGTIEVTPSFRQSMAELVAEPQARRRLLAVALGTIAFSLQDVLLEPYGGQVLGLPVAATTALTALLAVGGLCGFALGGWLLSRKSDQHRVAALGVLVGLCAFTLVIFAAPMQAPALFAIGTALIGGGAALFLVGTLSSAVDTSGKTRIGLKLGSWGAVQAVAAGTAIAAGGVLHDIVAHLALRGALGASVIDSATGYEAVYGLEMVLLFATLIVLGPLVRFSVPSSSIKQFEHPSRKAHLA
ncbi:BCD family MFS transporter [Acidisoma cladoniae]|uniref:BCD family MFS transporter n=1 Tax=Acidisoma cladoniae TaxID=3040935 RepID=UPI00254E1230|nr:BCD family MFS transporter [Acidisoma sp. PAMC 29798]